jgi:hypothetical protein
MHAHNLLSRLDGLTPEAAERWVAAALAEAAALREHDDQLYPPADDPEALRTAESFRDAWRQWADDADALLARLSGDGTVVAGAADLDYAVGLARAMLTLSPQAMQRRREQVARGDVHTIEEVRRELGLTDRR